jgi:FAD/FMN-containing dehydrogenase
MFLLDSTVNKWGRFSSIAAELMDEVLLEEATSILSLLWKALKLRLLYVGLFLPLVVLDLAVATLSTICLGVAAAFYSDKAQADVLEKFKFFATLIGKNFYALLASPIGLFEPEMVLFFTEPKKDNVVAEHPINEAELQALLARANDENLKVCVRGAGRSQGKQFLPADGERAMIIDMSHFNAVRINDDGTATVGAGAHWGEVQREANKNRKALKVMQASNIFSVGGSIGANIHGWDHHTGVLSNAIRSMDVLKADGSIVTTHQGEELFNHVAGGYGLYGIVLRATIELAPNELLKRTSVRVAPSDYLAHFNSALRDNTDNRMHLYRLSLNPKGLLKDGFTETYAVEDSTPRETEYLQSEAEQGTRSQRILVRLAKRYGQVRHQYWKDEAEHCANHEPLMTTNEVMQAPINAMFNHATSEMDWLQEYFLPGDQLASFVDALGDLLMENDVKLLNASVRFVKQYDASPLSYAPGCDRFAVVLCFNQSMQKSKIRETQKWLREAQKLAVTHQGSYYLPYQHVSSPETFAQSYPSEKIEAAKAAKAALDPDNRFASGMYDKYINPKPDTGAKHVKAIMSDAKHRETFKGFLTHILKRVNIDVEHQMYALLDDILLYADTHAEIYQALCDRLPEIMPNAGSDLLAQLDSLAAIKTELGEQAVLSLPASTTKIDGIVEIGSPGRYVNGFRKNYTVTGKIVTVNDSEPGLKDCIDAGALHPYDEHLTLDYNAMEHLASLEDNSADVVTCYVGLHHFPNEETLGAFLDAVRRVLRPNGHFLLVDHDVQEDSIECSMANMAHFIFNAVNGVPLADELAEVRDFKPIATWRALLEKHELFDATEGPDVPMIRAEDPTRNRMVVFSPTPKLVPIVTPVHTSDTRASVASFGLFGTQASYAANTTDTSPYPSLDGL